MAGLGVGALGPWLYPALPCQHAAVGSDIAVYKSASQGQASLTLMQSPGAED